MRALLVLLLLLLPTVASGQARLLLVMLGADESEGDPVCFADDFFFGTCTVNEDRCAEDRDDKLFCYGTMGCMALSLATVAIVTTQRHRCESSVPAQGTYVRPVHRHVPAFVPDSIYVPGPADRLSATRIVGQVRAATASTDELRQVAAENQADLIVIFEPQREHVGVGMAQARTDAVTVRVLDARSGQPRLLPGNGLPTTRRTVSTEALAALLAEIR